MARVLQYVALVAAFYANTISAQITVGPPVILPSKTCPCYTATVLATNPACPPFNPPRPCFGLDCVAIEIVTAPPYNPRCNPTPTKTLLRPCQTACPTGCVTSTYTTTTTLSFCPSSSTLTPSSKPPTTIPRSSRPCYTPTVTASKYCPEDDLGCPPPDCLYLTTTTVPAGAVEGCSVTPTVTKERTCKGRCDGSCGTVWVTESAAVWKRRA